MANKRKELSHEEVWDDRGLIESWNQAHEEYKLYHSIHARGENVNEVLAAAAAQAEDAGSNADASSAPANLASSAAASTLGAWRSLDEEPASAAPETMLKAAATETLAAKDTASAPVSARVTENGSNEAPPSAGMIQTLVASASTDESLKNLMMSWYWAGYYTGLLEGQQQQQQRQQGAAQKSEQGTESSNQKA